MNKILRRRFSNAFHSILRSLDFEELDRACNGKDPTYAQEILQQMHQAFLNIYRTDVLTDAGKRWNTVFITPVGVLSQRGENMSRIQKIYLQEKFLPYDFWYTPEVPCDMRINYDHVPHSVMRLVTACTGMEPEQAQRMGA